MSLRPTAAHAARRLRAALAPRGDADARAGLLRMRWSMALTRPKLPARVERVLVLCKGNICRSPFAAELLGRGLRIAVSASMCAPPGSIPRPATTPILWRRPRRAAMASTSTRHRTMLAHDRNGALGGPRSGHGSRAAAAAPRRRFRGQRERLFCWGISPRGPPRTFAIRLRARRRISSAATP